MFAHSNKTSSFWHKCYLGKNKPLFSKLKSFFTNGTFLPLNSNNPTDLAYPHSTWRGTNWIYVMHIHSSWSPGSLFHNNFTPAITYTCSISQKDQCVFSDHINETKKPMGNKKNPAIITTALTGFEQQPDFSVNTIWRSIVTLTFTLPYVVPNLNCLLSLLFVEHK